MSKGKIHIMHVVDSLDIGGLENGVVNLINRMNENRFINNICCISRSGRNAEKLHRSNVEIYEMKKGNGRELLLSIRLAQVFKGIQIDIVHTRNWGTIDGIIGAKLAGIPIVVHGEHGREIADPDGSNTKRNLIRKGLSYLVDHYVTVSKDLRKWLITVVGIDEKKVQNICNGVDIITFNPDGKDLIRAKYGYDTGEIVIGTIGRLDPVKDQQLLIRAFAQLTARYRNLTLLIIGDGPCRKDLEKLVRDLGIEKKVTFWGAREDVPELLRLLDIFVLPSIIEGISNTILEAMATGIPVIATNVGGNPELVIEGETGDLIPKGDIGALTIALERYILNKSIMKQHGVAARERAVKKFSLDQMVSQYEALYTYLMMRKINKVIAC